MMKIALLTLLLAATPALAQDAILVLGDDGGLARSEVHAIRSVTASALRQRGVSLSQESATEGVHPIDDTLAGLAQSLGARRIFVLRITGRLGSKIPLTLEELDARTLATLYSASLTATTIEECDVVAGRLAMAVVEHKHPDDTAEMRTVTAQESKPFAKKPGERFIFLGLPLPVYGTGTPLGFSFDWGYEAEFFRLQGSTGFVARDSDSVVWIMFSGAWIPLSGEWSPYLGGGLGYMHAGHQTGLGGSVEAGVELFRLHPVRLLAGFQLLVPFFDTSGFSDATGQLESKRSYYPAAFVRFGF